MFLESLPHVVPSGRFVGIEMDCVGFLGWGCRRVGKEGDLVDGSKKDDDGEELLLVVGGWLVPKDLRIASWGVEVYSCGVILEQTSFVRTLPF